PSRGAANSRQRSSQRIGNRTERDVQNLCYLAIPQSLRSQKQAKPVLLRKRIHHAQHASPRLICHILILGIQSGVRGQNLRRSRTVDVLKRSPRLAALLQRQVVSDAEQPAPQIPPR